MASRRRRKRVNAPPAIGSPVHVVDGVRAGQQGRLIAYTSVGVGRVQLSSTSVEVRIADLRVTSDGAKVVKVKP